MLGGYRPFPCQLGGGKPVARIYHEGVRAALPSVFSRDPTSRIDLESFAQARMLAAVWMAYERYKANQIPSTAYELLGGWARRLGVKVRDGDSVATVRSACSERYQIDLRGASPGAIKDAVEALLPGLSPAISWGRGADLDTPPADTTWPGNPGTDPWTSSRKLMTVTVTRPQWMSPDRLDFLMNNLLFEFLDTALPSAASFTWTEA